MITRKYFSQIKTYQLIAALGICVDISKLFSRRDSIKDHWSVQSPLFIPVVRLSATWIWFATLQESHYMHAHAQQRRTGYEPLLTKLLVSQILAGRHPVCMVHSQWKHPHNAESTQKQYTCKCKSIWSTSAQEGFVVPDTLQMLSHSQSKCLKVQLLPLPHCLESHCLAESFWRYFSVFDLTWCWGGIQDVAQR